jgi:hypothetical protein
MMGGIWGELALWGCVLGPGWVAADGADDDGATVAVDGRAGTEGGVALKTLLSDWCRELGFFEAKTMAAMNVQTTAVMLAGTFQTFHGETIGGTIKFRLWRVNSAPALSRSASRICRACSSDSRASGRFPSQSAFVPFWWRTHPRAALSPEAIADWAAKPKAFAHDSQRPLKTNVDSSDLAIRMTSHAMPNWTPQRKLRIRMGSVSRIVFASGFRPIQPAK